MSEQNVQVTQALGPCECGSEPSLYEDERDGARLHQVRCENCDTRGPAIEGCSVSYLGKARIDAHRAEAIAAWNHRTRAEPDLVEAAKKASNISINKGREIVIWFEDACPEAFDVFNFFRAALTRADV